MDTQLSKNYKVYYKNSYEMPNIYKISYDSDICIYSDYI